jgi:hypothetical protein
VRHRLISSRLAAVGVLGFLLLNYPLLSLFDLPRRVFGIPLLWIYLYLVWCALIAVLALIVRKAE